VSKWRSPGRGVAGKKSATRSDGREADGGQTDKSLKPGRRSPGVRPTGAAGVRAISSCGAEKRRKGEENGRRVNGKKGHLLCLEANLAVGGSLQIDDPGHGEEGRG